MKSCSVLLLLALLALAGCGYPSPTDYSDATLDPWADVRHALNHPPEKGNSP